MTRSKGLALVALAVGLSTGLPACGPGIALRGGQVVARGDEPPGKVLARYRAVGCVDAAGQPTVAQRGTIWLVRTADRQTKLVETASGHDSVVVENSFLQGKERVFQLSTNALPEPLLWGSNGRDDDVLFDYRLPVDGHGEGRLGLVKLWREERGEGGQVRAYFDRVALACRLSPDLVPSR
jgi:hypothetical protein